MTEIGLGLSLQPIFVLARVSAPRIEMASGRPPREFIRYEFNGSKSGAVRQNLQPHPSVTASLGGQKAFDPIEGHFMVMEEHGIEPRVHNRIAVRPISALHQGEVGRELAARTPNASIFIGHDRPFTKKMM